MIVMGSKMQVSNNAARKVPAGRKVNHPSRLVLVIALPFLALGALSYKYLPAGRYVSTDNAAVHASGTVIGSQASGWIADIEVRDIQHVKRGDVLFRFDDTPYRVAVAVAEAKLADARLHVEALKATYRQEMDNLTATKDVLAYHQREFDRQKQLQSKGIISQSEFDQETGALLDTRAKLVDEQQQIAEELAELGGNPDIVTDQHPLVRQARAQLNQALLELTNATIRAPTEGTIANIDRLQVGEYVQARTPLFELMFDHTVWVEAQFTKAQLADIGIGQPARITIEGHPGQTLMAHITGLDVGADSLFSLPGQEGATGDWVNGLWRSRVRLELDHSYPTALTYAGLDATVEVDTGRRPPLVRLMEAFL